MRVSLDNSKADCSQAEEAKMDMAYEIKVVGSKRRRPPPFFFPSLLVVLVGRFLVGASFTPLLPPLPPFSSFFSAFFCPLLGASRGKYCFDMRRLQDLERGIGSVAEVTCSQERGGDFGFKVLTTSSAAEATFAGRNSSILRRRRQGSWQQSRRWRPDDGSSLVCSYKIFYCFSDGVTGS